MPSIITLTSPNDIMVFHYAGKGVYTRRGLSPTLKLEKPLLLDEVAKVLQAKKLKLGLILADCRNQLTSSFPIAGTRGTIIGEERSKEITRKIFLENPCQIVEIASGRRNEDFLSFKTNSVFNYSLTESYEDMLYAEDLEKINLENFVRRIDNTSKSFIPTYTESEMNLCHDR
ncbi:MAG: hypothetical protein R2822_05615 [Spirosomataceae bacterium]